MIGWLRAKFKASRERLKGWKTVIVGAFVGLPLILFELVEQLRLADPATMLPEPWGQRVALGLAIAMILLRLITTGPVGAKSEKESGSEMKARD